MTDPAIATAPATVPVPEQPTDGTTGALGNAHISTHSLPSPRIAVHEDVAGEERRPSMFSHISAPTGQQFHSPMRQHKRTPSHHREVKETLNARSQYTNDETEGTKLRINQYIIREEIGRGSYGAVHLANDQYGNEYAIKEFSKSRLRKRAQSNILKRPTLRPERFSPGLGLRQPGSPHARQLSNQDAAEAKDALFLIREEIAIMKKLNHPNLVSLIEVLDDPEEDSLWMVLEMCKKGVIMKIALGEKSDPYSEEQCRYWFRDLILGIEYLHAQGIIHRDIKPDNLLLTQDDCLKIVDFGVSEMFEKPDHMWTAKSAGSPAFLPPELCMARHGDISGKAADIWSMGVSLYCLKYGNLPFHEDNVLDMYQSIRTDELSLPSEDDSQFVDLMHKILVKDPNSRICMRDIRTHPWVTQNGEDPLLSEEDNCSNLVEPPNELEVNHALTPKMSHMMTVVMAIHKFKSLVSKSRVGTPDLKSSLGSVIWGVPNQVSGNSQESQQIPAPEERRDTSQLEGRPRHKSIAEEAAELVEARKAYHASSGHSDKTIQAGEKGHAHDPTEDSPQFLGIGLGGKDDFVTSPTPVNVVSDSPTGIDFDVYDRAFEAEVEKIRSKKQGSRRTAYLTKLVNEKEKYLGDDCMIVEAGRNIPAFAKSKATTAATKTLGHIGLGHHEKKDDDEKAEPRDEESREPSVKERTASRDSVQTIKDQSHRFAGIVLNTLQSAKSKAVGESKDSTQPSEDE